MKGIKMILASAAIAVMSMSAHAGTLADAVESARGADFDASVKVYQELIKAEPDNALYHNNLGWVSFRNADFKEARVSFEKALTLDSGKSIATSIQSNLKMLAEYESSRESICIDLENGNGLAKLESADDFTVSFKYKADEVGYLLVSECFKSKGDTANFEKAHQKMVKLYEDGGVSKTLSEKALAMK